MAGGYGPGRRRAGALLLLFLAGACRDPAEPPAPEERGPGTLLVVVVLPGDDAPGAEDLARRWDVERRIREAGVGRVVRAGGGLGRMEIAVEVDDLAAARGGLRRILDDALPESRYSLERLPP